MKFYYFNEICSIIIRKFESDENLSSSLPSFHSLPALCSGCGKQWCSNCRFVSTLQQIQGRKLPFSKVSVEFLLKKMPDITKKKLKKIQREEKGPKNASRSYEFWWLFYRQTNIGIFPSFVPHGWKVLNFTNCGANCLQAPLNIPVAELVVKQCHACI